MRKNNKKSNSILTKIKNNYEDNVPKDAVTFWKRALAFILDLMIINIIIIYPFRASFTKYFGNFTLAQSLKSDIILPTSIYWIVLIISFLAMLYFTFFEYYLSQTPGKMILKIKVVSLNSDNSDDISFWKSALRNCFILPFFPFYILWVIEPMYILFYKESFLERITHTRTVYEYKHSYDSKNTSSNKDDEEYKLEKV